MQYLKENIIKNLCTIVIVLISTPLIAGNIHTIQDKDIRGIIGLFGLLLVYSGAVNFTFSYESVDLKNNLQRTMAHITTFLAQTIMAMLLIAVYFLIQETYPDLSAFTFVISFFSIVAMLLFDFLDFYKNKYFAKSEII